MRPNGVVVALLLMSFLLSLGIAEQPQQKRMDIWEALDISLKHAKSIHAKNGFVPDGSTAVKIADAVAVGQFGEQRISRERPFIARLQGNIWTVQGTLHPEGADGGTAVVKLSKTDGRILFVVHQK